MRVLLKEEAAEATSRSILVSPQRTGSTLETLAGDPVDKGVLADVGVDVVVSAINTAVRSRREEFISGKEVHKDLKWLNKALGEYEIGSKIAIKPTPGGFAIDDSEATRIDRAKGLGKGDTIAVGPTVSPRYFINAHGTAVTVKRDGVTVDLDPGDRDRIERATGNEIPGRMTFPRACVEKVS